MRWTFEGDLDGFYEKLRWRGWEQEIEQIGGDQALSLYPAPWTTEGKDLSAVSRRAVPAREVWLVQQDVVCQLGG